MVLFKVISRLVVNVAYGEIVQQCTCFKISKCQKYKNFFMLEA
ncbi:hypothetical protein [Helicobacter apodemus]|nr:hypothetical protein [Helicobacter apodemus]